MFPQECSEEMINALADHDFRGWKVLPKGRMEFRLGNLKISGFHLVLDYIPDRVEIKTDKAPARGLSMLA